MSDGEANKKSDPADKRIFVADDDDEIREMLFMTLKSEGFDVAMSRDARDIVSKVLNARAHLVLSDVMMPGGGGYDVVRSLAANENTSKIPIIIMTGHGFDDSTKVMFEQEKNVAAFFLKPIQLPALLGKIHKTLNTLSNDEKMIEEQKKKNNQFEMRDFDELG